MRRYMLATVTGPSWPNESPRADVVRRQALSVDVSGGADAQPRRRPPMSVAGSTEPTARRTSAPPSQAFRKADLVNRRAGYAAFAWVVVFVVWHVVWYVTGLAFPTSSHFHGNARVVATVVNTLIVLMFVIGCILPLALAQPWGRRMPRWMRLSAAWTATGLLAARGLSGILDDLLRALGFPRGLTGLTTAQTAGTSHITFWVQFSGVITDVLFAAGAVAFAAAALAHRRTATSRLTDPASLGG